MKRPPSTASLALPKTLAVLLGCVLAFGFSAPAVASELPPEPPEPATAPAATGARSNAPSFTPDLETEIFIGEDSRPTDFTTSADGSLGYVTAAELPEFIIIDMESREVVKRIPFPGDGADKIRVSADGSRAYFGVFQNYFTRSVGIVDLTTQSLVTVLPPTNGIISQIALSQDGRSLYTLDLSGQVRRLDAATGEELAVLDLRADNNYGLLLMEDDTKLLVTHERTIYSLDALTLAHLEPAFDVAGVGRFANMSVDPSGTRVYFTDGAYLGLLDPVTHTAQRVSVGPLMVGTVGDDSGDRVFSGARQWDMVMAADFSQGKRSESVRTTPTAPNSVAKNPVTGDLLVAVGGWVNATKGSTVSIFHAPRVTDPADVTVASTGETVRLAAEAIGIKRGHGGGIVWQSSPDGTTWTDIDGAVNEQLDVVVDDTALTQQYRLRWADDFWGQHGVSAPAKISLAQAPQITYSGPLPEGKVGEGYPATVIAAEGAADLVWSIDEQRGDLPAGMTLDPENGTLQGTPERAGTYTFNIVVTDAFGTDSKEFELTIGAAEGGVVTPPSPPETETPGSDPAAPGSLPADEQTLPSTGGASPGYFWALALACIAAGLVVVRSVPKR